MIHLCMSVMKKDYDGAGVFKLHIAGPSLSENDAKEKPLFSPNCAALDTPKNAFDHI